METKEKNQILFIHLVGMFEAIAWQQLGKVTNPVTKTVERNMEGARGAIDTLEMLRDKTEGHLSVDERRFLDETLKNLRLNYVDEINREKKAEGVSRERTEHASDENIDNRKPEQA
jgi:hypothetical protein